MGVNVPVSYCVVTNKVLILLSKNEGAKFEVRVDNSVFYVHGSRVRNSSPKISILYTNDLHNTSGQNQTSFKIVTPVFTVGETSTLGLM